MLKQVRLAERDRSRPEGGTYQKSGHRRQMIVCQAVNANPDGHEHSGPRILTELETLLVRRIIPARLTTNAEWITLTWRTGVRQPPERSVVYLTFPSSGG